MRILSLATLLALSALTAAAASRPASDWTGVWQITTPGMPGGVINLAGDVGPNGTALTGIIVFYVINRETGQRIAIEPRTMVNLHIEGDALVFQVRRILKPHLPGDPPAPDQAFDPSDVVDMTLTLSSQGKATLTCPKCGEATPTSLVKMQ